MILQLATENLGINRVAGGNAPNTAPAWRSDGRTQTTKEVGPRDKLARMIHKQRFKKRFLIWRFVCIRVGGAVAVLGHATGAAGREVWGLRQRRDDNDTVSAA